MNTPYIENVKENTKYVEVQVCPIFNVHNGDTASFIVEEKKKITCYKVQQFNKFEKIKEKEHALTAVQLSTTHCNMLPW